MLGALALYAITRLLFLSQALFDNFRNFKRSDLGANNVSPTKTFQRSRSERRALSLSISRAAVTTLDLLSIGHAPNRSARYHSTTRRRDDGSGPLCDATTMLIDADLHILRRRPPAWGRKKEKARSPWHTVQRQVGNWPAARSQREQRTSSARFSPLRSLPSSRVGYREIPSSPCTPVSSPHPPLAILLLLLRRQGRIEILLAVRLDNYRWT